MDALELLKNATRNLSPEDLVSPVSIAQDLDEEEERAWAAAREERIKTYIEQCGSYFRQPDPRNGRNLIKYKVSCGYWRKGCQPCLESRAREFETRFHHCIEDVNGVEYLGIAQLTKSQAKSITKKMRRAGTRYWRIPLVSGGVLLIFDALHFSDLNNPELHDDLDWLTLCQTPEKSRYSGSLGRREEEEKTGLVVKIPRFKIEKLEDHNIDVAWSMTLRKTEDLLPKYDVEQIEEALQARMDVFEETIISMGGEIAEKYRVMSRVQEVNFGWEVPSTLGVIRPDGSLLGEKEPPPGFMEDVFDY